MTSLILIIIASLIFSAFFSGMEIAFVSANKLMLEIDRKQSNFIGGIIDIFKRHPGQYITSILVGNNIALVIYSLNMSALISLVASRYDITWLSGSVILDTAISTVIIIFLAEYIPKTVFRASPNFYLRLFALPVFVFYIIFYPIAKFSTMISVVGLRIFGLKLNNKSQISTFDKVDLSNLLEESEGENAEHKTETEIKLFQNALDFSDLRVRDCMLPRVEIVAIEANSSIEQITALFCESNYSRIFVYDQSIDNIIGYVNTKSLFRCPKTIAEVLMPVGYVTETMTAQRLLSNLIKTKRSVSIVIDEFGGTAGMISLEDVLEEIFGEIEDEHDEIDMVERKNADGSYEFSCRLEVEYLNEEYELKLEESDEYETLGGYIIFHQEGIPQQGDVITIDNKVIKVLKMSASKLDLVSISSI